MIIDALRSKKIGIVGLGVEGLSTLRYLLKQGITPCVMDEKLSEENEDIKALRALNIHYALGENAFEEIERFEIIFRSPGVSFLRPELQHAKEKGVEITSQTNFFLQHAPCLVIGVTGTKGKGTTSTLIYEMLKSQSFDAYLGGNIGQPPLDFLDSLDAQSKVVLELSSFQLEDVKKSPHIAVVLMITSDHLTPTEGTTNYHATLDDYISAKRNILRYQLPSDFSIINRDYPASLESDILTEGKVIYVSRERETENACFTIDGKIIVRRNGQDEEIIKTSEVALIGKHNLENACAAVMAAKLNGVSSKNIVSVLKTFKGLEHRLQFVGEVREVKYYDDSISTTPESTIAAIEAFSAPKILILGGVSAGSDFSMLGEVIRKSTSIKAIIGIGREWERMKEQMINGQLSMSNNTVLFIEGAKSMQQVVLAASKIAQMGDVVLLSPACKSFDMFKSYKDRGEQFQKEVKSLL